MPPHRCSKAPPLTMHLVHPHSLWDMFHVACSSKCSSMKFRAFLKCLFSCCSLGDETENQPSLRRQ